MDTMDTLPTAASPAEIYHQRFVPALFGQWGPVVARAAKIGAGDDVLDVACGTGALTLAASALVGPTGRVVGLDANPEMLAVARRQSRNIDWQEGRAEELPFADGRFDAVASQFGYMFFADRPKTLAEMMRVLRNGGRLAVAVCGALERSPGYATFAALLDRLFGEDIGKAFRAPFALGDPALLERDAAEAGIGEFAIEQQNGQVRFASIADLVATERACVWTLGGALNDAQFERLLAEAEIALRPFAGTDRSVTFDMPALILTASKAG